MRNIELKARCADLTRAEATCQRLGATRAWARRQTDIYFRAPSGRLKLRITDAREASLVSYHRPDTASARESNYEITPVDDVDETAASLESRYGVAARVEKTRTLYQLGNVRIHLDAVEGLGTFIEFEAVMAEGDDDAETHARLEQLRSEFGIAADDLIASSYGDLVMERAERDP